MKKILNKNFTLPSVEQRWMPEGTVKNIFYTYFDKERDDTYIYFIILLLGVTFTAIFSGIYLSTYFFNYKINLGFINIGLSNNEPVRDFINSFPLVVPTFLLLIVLPFGFFLFLRNVNMQKLDLLNWNVKGVKLRNMDKRKLYKTQFIGFCLLIIAIYGSYGLPELVLNSYNYGIDFSQSINFLLFWSLFFSYLYALCVTFILIVILTYYQNKNEIGPYYNNTKKGI